MTEAPATYADEHPGYEITTTEEAVNWITEQIELIKKVALGCVVTFPDDGAKTARFRQMAYRQFLTRHGGLLGQIAALYRCKKLTPDSYSRLKSEAMDLLGPSIVIGRYNWANHIGADVELTEDGARTWVLDQVDRVAKVRIDCNVIFPDDEQRTVQHQQTAERHLMVGHGGVLGMLVALHRCRRLSDVAYNEIRAKAMQALVPTVVGESRLGAGGVVS